MGHNVIATAQIYAQVADLRREAEKERLKNLRVERLDLLDEYDIRTAQTWDIDVLFTNAGMGEAGPRERVLTTEELSADSATLCRINQTGGVIGSKQQ